MDLISKLQEQIVQIEDATRVLNGWGINEPTNMQIKSYLDYTAADYKGEPSNAIQHKSCLYNALGLDHKSKKIVQQYENAIRLRMDTCQIKTAQEKFDREISQLADRHENSFSQTLEQRAFLQAFLVNGEPELGKIMSEKVIRTWTESYSRGLYYPTKYYDRGQAWNMALSDAAKIIRIAKHLRVRKSKFELFEPTTRERYKEARKIARKIVKKDKEVANFFAIRSW